MVKVYNEHGFKSRDSDTNPGEFEPYLIPFI